MVLGAGCPGRQAAGGVMYTGRQSPAGRGCVGECERLAERGPSAAAGGGHELSKKTVNVLRHTRGRCPYPTPLRLGLFRFPGPCSLGLVGEAVVGRDGGGPGVRRRQGIKGGLSREGQEKVELSFRGVDPEKESMHTICTPNKKEVSRI